MVNKKNKDDNKIVLILISVALLFSFAIVIIGAGHGVCPVGLLLFLGEAEE